MDVLLRDLLVTRDPAGQINTQVRRHHPRWFMYFILCIDSVFVTEESPETIVSR